MRAQSSDVGPGNLGSVPQISRRARHAGGFEQHTAGLGVAQAEEETLLDLPDAAEDVLGKLDAALALFSGGLDASKDQSDRSPGQRALSRAHGYSIPRGRNAEV